VILEGLSTAVCYWKDCPLLCDGLPFSVSRPFFLTFDLYRSNGNNKLFSCSKHWL